MIIDTFLESLPPAVIGGVAALVWATTVGSIGLWTYRDARARESGSPVLWAVGLVFALVLFPLYFYLRRPERNTPPARLDRGLATLASSGVSAFLVGAVFSPPDPITQDPTSQSATPSSSRSRSSSCTGAAPGGSTSREPFSRRRR